MGRYRKNPVEIEAVQFHGYNWSEVQKFAGFRKSQEGYDIQLFNRLGTYLPTSEAPCDGTNYTAELWVEANKRWLPIEVGEWVLKDELGCYPCKDEQFQKNYTRVLDKVEPLSISVDAEPNAFGESAEYHDSETLSKVNRALYACLRDNGYLPDDAERVSLDIITAVQNVGILFRERSRM